MLRTTLPPSFFKFVIRLSGVQYVTMQKYFSHPSSIIYFFLTPPIKIKLGLQIGRRLLIDTRLDQSNTLANRQQVLGFAAPFTSLSKLCKMQGQNHFADPNWHGFTFLHQIYNLQGHILNIGGVALLHFVLQFQIVPHKKTRKLEQHNIEW